MIRRFRFATSLIALLTVFAYAAGGAAALVFCGPAATTAQMTDVAGADVHTDHGGSAPATDQSGSSHENHCPLGMTGGSCAVASLPAALPQGQAAPATTDRDWAAPMATLESGAVHPLFHPPRA